MDRRVTAVFIEFDSKSCSCEIIIDKSKIGLRKFSIAASADEPLITTVTMATKRPAATVLDALDNTQDLDRPPPVKKPRGRPRGSVNTKKKSGKFNYDSGDEADVYMTFMNLPLAAVVVDDDDEEAPDTAVAAPAPPAATKISYTIDIYSISQMKKIAKTRGDPKRSVMVLNSDEPWDTFKAQTLTRVEKVLKPPTISFDDYKVTFTVPRLQKTTDLEDEESYEFMIGRATRSGDPTAVICIEPLVPEVSCISRLVILILTVLQLSDSDKENKGKNSDNNTSSESGSEDEGRKRKGKKKKGKGKSKKVHPSLALGSCHH